MLNHEKCPHCGTDLSADASMMGLCPSCLLGLADEGADGSDGAGTDEASVDASGAISGVSRGGSGGGSNGPVKVDPELQETLFMEQQAAITAGQLLGDRYQIRSLLGRGGMGEVWRAFDLKLRVEVALKALRRELMEDELAVDLLRQEVRSARDVVSPNVCRVFDLVTEDDQELVSMEIIDGTTLLDILKERGPLDVTEATKLAAQFLAGLEAIHQAGLVHRDLKPENIMITRTGRVVVMDLGIAKAQSEKRTGTISGTPAYMAPEQARGEAVDPRADIYSAGVVLAEMVSPDGVRAQKTRKALWQALREDPKNLPEGPWKQVLTRAIAWQPEDRFPSASALARALEEITLRSGTAQERSPYPGLASFSEADAEYFFGREQEIEALWKKLDQPHLLAVVGASGAGKSSFLRAGVLPTRPEGWGCVICSPGTRPLTALGQVLATELAGDAEAVRDLLRFEELDVAVSVASRWRQRHSEALLIVDQFEELFTLSSRETQATFTELLGRLALEADIHVLVSMRDDFLLQCHGHEALQPIFAELTPLAPPKGPSLRRALAQPALLCGYRFEDDQLLDDMLAEVANERGALPLLAFAASALWERRDRERGLLTRQAYEEIGGVAGALARHAESTLEQIGSPRLPVVRELFSHLVTSQGTRAVLDSEELLSVFEDQKIAAQVLQQLIEARLLTSFKHRGEENGSSAGRRVEIIHESLLEAWPRLVRWRTQDADQTQLRDQLRQVAQVWEERSRADDLLWTGTSFREYELWRERYSGGMTATEQAYAEAMETHAARQQRRRRLAVGATMAFLLVVTVAISGLWLQSRRSEREAIAQAARAEASKLFAIGQLEAEDHPTAALAHAIKSLELADSPEVRKFAVEMLWRGPTAFVLGTTEDIPPLFALFSPDGRWLLESGLNGRLRLWASDSGEPRFLDGHELSFVLGMFSFDSEWIVSHGLRTSRIWELPDASQRWQLDRDYLFAEVYEDRILAWSPVEEGRDGIQRRLIRSWPLAGGDPESLGVYQVATPVRFEMFQSVPANQSLVYSSDGALYELSLEADETIEPRQIVSGDDPLASFYARPQGDQLVTAHLSGALGLWSRPIDRDKYVIDRTFRGDPKDPATFTTLDPGGKWLAAGKSSGGSVDLWDLGAPSGAEPLVLRHGAASRIQSAVFNPVDSWLSTLDQFALTLWPVSRDYARVLSVPEDDFRNVVFDPDGEWVAVSSTQEVSGSIWIWDLAAGGQGRRKLLEEVCETGMMRFDVSPDGEILLVSSPCGAPRLVPVSGGPVRELPEFLDESGGGSSAVAFDARGERIAVARGAEHIKVWTPGRDDIQVLDPGEQWPILGLAFTPDGDLLSASIGSGLRRWNLDSGTSELLLEGTIVSVKVRPDGRYAVVSRSTHHNIPVGEVLIYDLEQKTHRVLESHGSEVSMPIWHPDGERIISPSLDGTIRVGPITGEEPHLLPGHKEMVWGVDVDSSGRWIASASTDGTVRIWPMPEGQPLHSLPQEELIEKLETLTNYRMVEDGESSTGYRIDYEPFAGWNQELPTW